MMISRIPDDATRKLGIPHRSENAAADPAATAKNPGANKALRASHRSAFSVWPTRHSAKASAAMMEAGALSFHTARPGLALSGDDLQTFLKTDLETLIAECAETLAAAFL